MISEISYLPSQMQTNQSWFVYGLDLSGTLQGAGTIGGLLATVRSGDPEPVEGFYAYDANGNVTDLVGMDGAIAAHYEYDPYGNTVVKTGPLADANPFRFSSKYTDGETGLYYYGYRYYQSETGRWLNRDLIEETAFRQVVALSQRKVSPLASGALFDTFSEDNEFDEYVEWEYVGDEESNVPFAAAVSYATSHGLAGTYVFVLNAPTDAIDPLGLAEHKKKTPCKWDKHTKPRPGRECEKKRQHPGWKPRNPKKWTEKACVGGVVAVITWIVICDPIPGDELAWACCLVIVGTDQTSEKCCCPADGGGT
jgi:RHS repeat-associated protein